jgi:hypothetical protein
VRYHELDRLPCPLRRRVGARLLRAQDVVGDVAVPAKVKRTVGRAVFLYITAQVGSSLFCRGWHDLIETKDCAAPGFLCVLEPQFGTSRIGMLGTGFADLDSFKFPKVEAASARWQMFLGGPGATIRT